MERGPLTYEIIGCAMRVHNSLGPGFQEVIYQWCLAIEFQKVGLGFQREQEHAIYYDELEIGSRRVDFVVEDKIIVEIKAIIKLEDVHIIQAKNYTVCYDYPTGLLINFGSVKMEHKLIFNPKYHPWPK